jgi:hypothetical protein
MVELANFVDSVHVKYGGERDLDGDGKALAPDSSAPLSPSG